MREGKAETVTVVSFFASLNFSIRLGPEIPKIFCKDLLAAVTAAVRNKLSLNMSAENVLKFKILVFIVTQHEWRIKGVEKGWWIGRITTIKRTFLLNTFHRMREWVRESVKGEGLTNYISPKRILCHATASQWQNNLNFHIIHCLLCCLAGLGWAELQTLEWLGNLNLFNFQRQFAAAIWQAQIDLDYDKKGLIYYCCMQTTMAAAAATAT